MSNFQNTPIGSVFEMSILRNDTFYTSEMTETGYTISNETTGEIITLVCPPIQSKDLSKLMENKIAGGF